MTMKHTVIDSQLGELTLVTDGTALTGLYFPHHWYRPSDVGERDDTAFDFGSVALQLEEYLAGARTDFDLPVRLNGDAFQRQVWALIREIPYGETRTYGDLADALGDRSLARDVGAAVGRNPVSVVVPCHRVVGKDGKLTGYAGGLPRKRRLLELEAPAAVLF